VLVKLVLLVEKVAALRTLATKTAPEHVLAEHQIGAARPAAAVELLLGSIIDAWNTHGRQLNGNHIEGQRAVIGISAKARLASALPDLIVVIDQRDHAVPIPPVEDLIIEDPVTKQREVILRLAVAGDHPLQFTGNVFDPQGRVQSALLHHLPGHDPAAADFAHEKEPLLADALRELTDRIAEGS